MRTWIQFCLCSQQVDIAGGKDDKIKISSHKLFKKRVMYKDFLSDMNTHPHTEDQATCTDYFPKHLAGNLQGHSLQFTLNFDSPFNVS